MEALQPPPSKVPKAQYGIPYLIARLKNFFWPKPKPPIIQEPPMEKRSREELIALLEFTIAALKDNDTYEGNLSYTLFREGLAPGEYWVNCFVRFDNKRGQGAVRIIPWGSQ